MDPQTIKRRGVMLVLSSPSGTGKSTISRNLLESNKNLELSVSVTTRARRGSEIDGRHYHFVSEREFNRLREDDALLEWAEVHGNYYGTPREAVDIAMGEGRDVLFDIDYQGGQQLMEKARFDVVSIFLLPPSMQELQSRLVRRAEDAPDVIQKRLNNAIEEIPHWKEYDYVVINNDLDRAFSEVQSILTAERLRKERSSPALFEYEKFLLSGAES